jgi:hypothetical protein
MRGYADNTYYVKSCTACGHGFERSARWFMANAVARCRSCGMIIDFRDEAFVANIVAAEAMNAALGDRDVIPLRSRSETVLQTV